MRLGADASAAGRRENASYCWSSPFCQSLVTRLIVSISRDGALDRDWFGPRVEVTVNPGH